MINRMYVGPMSVMESYGHESEFGGTFIFARRPAARNRGASTREKRYTSRSCDRISIECSVSGATLSPCSRTNIALQASDLYDVPGRCKINHQGISWAAIKICRRNVTYLALTQ